MANLELVQYIKSQIEKNIDWEKIKGDLLRVGWALEIVEESYQQVLKMQPPQTPAAIKPTPANLLPEEPVAKMLPQEKPLVEANTPANQFTQPQQTAPSYEPFQAESIQQEPAQSSEPIETFSKAAALFEKPKKKSPLLWIIFLIVLILGIGGGAYAYYQYFYPQQIFYRAVENGIKKFGDDKVSETAIALNGVVVLKQGFPLETIGTDTVYKYISFEGNLTVDSDLSNADNLKALLSVAARTSIKPDIQSSESINVSAAADARLEKNLYFVIKEFNIKDIFSEDAQLQVEAVVQSIQNQWIKALSEKDIQESSKAYLELLEQEKQKKSKNYDKYKNDLKSAIQVKLLGSEKLEKDDCFRYQIVFDKIGVKNLIKKIADDYAKENSMQSSYSEEGFEYMWPDFQKIDIKIWVVKNSASFKKVSLGYENNFEKYTEFPVASLNLNLIQTYKKLEPNAVAVIIPENFQDFESIYSNLMQSWASIIKEKDRSVKSNLGYLQNVANDYFVVKKTYVGFNVQTDASAPEIIKTINNSGGRAAFIYIAKDKYCIIKELPETKGTYWCIDSNGYIGESNNCTKKTYSCK